MNAVGGHIRRLRKRDGMTQQALADRLSVTRQAVSQWENGNTQPDLETLEAVAGVFGVDMMALIYGEQKQASAMDPSRRRRYLTGLIVFGALALATGVVRLIWGPYFDEWARLYFDFRPAVIFGSVTGPLFYIAVAIAALNGGSLVWDIRIQQQKARRLVLGAGMAVIILYCTVPLGFFIVHEGMIARIFFDVTVFLVLNPAIFLLPGILLFLGLSGRRTGQKDAGAM